MTEHTTNTFVDRKSGSFRRLPLADRFWANITKSADSSCWGWQASRFKCGYGQISHLGKPHYAHRISYQLHFGSIPDGLEVCHRCDNKACCNPEHLFLGTHLQNMNDMRQKNRDSKPPRHVGATHHQAKLSEDDVREIRKRYAEGESQSKIAKAFGVTQANISSIVLRKTW